MNDAVVEQIARAILYEGYLLYPYRPSSVKNRQRWTFGNLYPEPYSRATSCDPSSMQTECLVAGGPDAVVRIVARFLHLVERSGGDAAPWQEAVEREAIVEAMTLQTLLKRPRRTVFAFDASREEGAGVVRPQSAIDGAVEVTASRLEEGLHRVTVRVFNLTPLPDAEQISRDEVLLHTLVSTHAVLGVTGGEFVSLLDPPQPWREHAAACRNVGVWPVLVGEEGQKDTVLASPIILYDYPRVAPESPGDLFDGTEIDEILTLRILTLTDAEKREVAGDERGRVLLERTETLARAQMMALHGAMRGLRLDSRVRLRPKRRADVFDLALDGKTATVEAIEQDFEDRIFVAVSVDDDPGRDLGALGKPAHRFFFRAEEVESLDAGATP